MILVIIAIGIMFMILERIFPDQELPHSSGWWSRVILINVLQTGVVLTAGATWDVAFDRYSLLNLQMGHPAAEAVLAYLIVTFVFYWWHRWRHEVEFLWRVFHQVHHSPIRIETITSFYKNPLEICVNSLLIGFVIYFLLGFSIEVGAWLTLYTATAEFLYHMNIRTPHWVGYVFQRPEMHRVHHERGKHYMNFSDLPLWDMLFGTYRNPRSYNGPCGFKPPREQMLKDMLLMRNVNNSKAPRSS